VDTKIPSGTAAGKKHIPAASLFQISDFTPPYEHPIILRKVLSTSKTAAVPAGDIQSMRTTRGATRRPEMGELLERSDHTLSKKKTKTYGGMFR